MSERGGHSSRVGSPPPRDLISFMKEQEKRRRLEFAIDQAAKRLVVDPNDRDFLVGDLPNGGSWKGKQWKVYWSVALEVLSSFLRSGSYTFHYKEGSYLQTLVEYYGSRSLEEGWHDFQKRIIPLVTVDLQYLMEIVLGQKPRFVMHNDGCAFLYYTD